MTSSEAAHSHSGPSYFLIFGMLIVLTGLTVGVSYVDFGVMGGIVVALAIATVKASLVALFFMHLKDEVRSINVVIIFPCILMIIMIAILCFEVF